MNGERDRPRASEEDRGIVAGQLGREPAPFRVAARCPAGRPSVIENERRREMPTTFWLTCPSLAAAISRIEAAGGVRQAQEDLGAEAVEGVHAEHMRRYGSRVAGVGAGGAPGRVKCLHAFTALQVSGALPNPVAEWTLSHVESTYLDPARCPECVGLMEERG
ncbi:MAG: FIG004853: possible toxin to DivIC [uncultured Rubrobacteraceae bacterium]|uniref:FIG004853: possible toxin to DivIC n=1 Tax=uncultured Rubrobacteraceae bacterium TaxID=349277 RepID=A0A6J4R6V1_9ACTN|nr:MAG: FIG004853: possible toxin to DivIC [uncultured Rubrobacteraceae bacterium]